MKSRIPLAIFILLCASLTLSLAFLDPNVTANSETPLAIDTLSLKGNSTEDMPHSTAKMMEETIILNQTFDGEPVGADPQGWNITAPQHGALTVDNQTYYRGNASARFVDNSTEGAPCPYRTFPPQNGTIVVTFAIRPTANSGDHTNLIIYVDDGDFSGSNIHFTENGTVKCHDDDLSYLLGTYSADVWYEIKLIMNIPNSTYEIYIDDHLKARNVPFKKFDEHHKIRRIVFGEALVWQPIGYIDDLLIRRGIKVPEDYPTIQSAIDAANPADTVLVDSGVYYEYLLIKNKKGLRLIGENRDTTIIDGKFGWEIMPIVSLQHSDNITVSGFTIRNGVGDGISVSSSNNNITDNLISSNLGCGVQIEGEGNVGNIVSGNVIENNEIGVNCRAAEGNTLYHNKFVSNNVQAVDYGSNNWDHDYPDGGNYWSDYTGVDDDGDGIGDMPHVVNSTTDSIDRYPLCLIEKVIKPIPPSYHQKATITAITTKDVQVREAVLLFTYNSTWENKTMKISANNLTAKILEQPYGTVVQYRVNASNVHGVWVMSATFNYTVTDRVPPVIGDVLWTPKSPFENQTVAVTANLTEPPTASGVDEAFVYWKADGGDWSPIKMSNNSASQLYNAKISRLPAGIEVIFYVKAFDRAGNNRTEEGNHTYRVRRFPELLITDWNGSLDFGVVSKGKTADAKFNVTNGGDGILIWRITVEEGAPWLSVEPDYGNVSGGESETITATVITRIREKGKWKYLSSGDHRWRLLVTSNEGKETLLVFVRVTQVRIDRAEASVPRHKNADVGSNQTIFFHAVWDDKLDDVQFGEIKIARIVGQTKRSLWYATNATGWISFPESSSEVGEMEWRVMDVKCKYIYKNETYWIRSFNVTVRDYPVGIIWNRVQITLNIADDRIDVDSPTNITWTGICEYDGEVFNGSIILNNTLTIPFDESLTQKYNTTGRRCYNVTSISDPKYGLTDFTSNIVCCIWDRIKIIGGGASQTQTYTNHTETVWFSAVYEYDGSWFTNMTVDGTEGGLYINQTENSSTSPHVNMTWSSDDFRWERNFSFPTVGVRTFQVSKILDSQYNLTRWVDTVGPVSIVWDGIKIIGGGVSRAQTYINHTETVFFIAVQEHDRSFLDDRKGRLYVNGSEMRWSNESYRWELDYTFDTAGVRTFQVSEVIDNLYELISFDDAFGPVSITWLEPVETGWLELSFTVDGKTPTENATYTVEYSDGTLYGIYRNKAVTISDVPVGPYHIICTYKTQELSEDATIKEGENEVVFNFKMLPPPEEWWMWTIVYTIIGGVGLSQFLLLVRRRRARALTT